MSLVMIKTHLFINSKSNYKCNSYKECYNK